MPSSLKHTEPSPRPFNVSVDHQREIITIQGINYTFGLFDQLGFGAKGARFEIGERGDGAVTLHAIGGLAPTEQLKKYGE